jgi:hypothetical protein
VPALARALAAKRKQIMAGTHLLGATLNTDNTASDVAWTVGGWIYADEGGCRSSSKPRAYCIDITVYAQRFVRYAGHSRAAAYFEHDNTICPLAPLDLVFDCRLPLLIPLASALRQGEDECVGVAEHDDGWARGAAACRAVRHTARGSPGQRWVRASRAGGRVRSWEQWQDRSMQGWVAQVGDAF